MKSNYLLVYSYILHGVHLCCLHLTFKGAQTALSTASSRGHYEVAELLLDSGASVNAMDDVSRL